MKKIFLMFLVCCTACIYADDKEPIFEETNEIVKLDANVLFAVEEPVFDEGDEKKTPAGLLCNQPPQFNDENQLQASYTYWPRYKTNFGIEQLLVRFPQNPAVSKSNTFYMAYAYDGAVMYSAGGYFPPIGSINSVVWFDEIRCSFANYPFDLITHSVYKTSNGTWVMDYIVHDCAKDFIIQGRSIVTPFNGYTLQCIKPNGSHDYFEYFLNNFYILCEDK